MIKTPKIFYNCLMKYLGYSKSLQSNTNKAIQLSWFIIMEIYLSNLIYIINQSQHEYFQYSSNFIVLVLIFMGFVAYYILFFLPKWSNSEHLRIIVQSEYSEIYYLTLLRLELLFIFVVFPTIIYILMSLSNENDVSFDILKVLVLPFMFNIYNMIILLISFQISITKYTCHKIGKYLDQVEHILIEKSNQPIMMEICKYQQPIEKWCRSVNELMSRHFGVFLSTFTLFGCITLIKIFSTSELTTEKYFDMCSIFFYFGMSILVLYHLTFWNSIFQKKTEEWNVRGDIIPNIVRNFGTIQSFEKWLENHECHAVRIFEDGIRINQNFYKKCIAIFCSLCTFLISYITNY